MKIGIIGGSGLYEIDGLEDVTLTRLETPFGEPSDAYCCARMGARELVFLPRHGRGHRLLPSEINHRANIYGFKQLGVDCIVSVSAVGSLREELRPRDVVLPDQFFDRTKMSGEHTFFGGGVVAHVSLAEPTCHVLRSAIATTAEAVIKDAGLDVRVNSGGTYINMEGPAFSTKAESHVYRKLGFDVIGMTALGEAKLCREAEICYQGIAMVTDYDCWHASEAAVTVDMVIGHLKANTALAKTLVRQLAETLPASRACTCRDALKAALMTPSHAIPETARERLELLIGKYL